MKVCSISRAYMFPVYGLTIEPFFNMEHYIAASDVL